MRFNNEIIPKKHDCLITRNNEFILYDYFINERTYCLLFYDNKQIDSFVIKENIKISRYATKDEISNILKIIHKNYMYDKEIYNALERKLKQM